MDLLVPIFNKVKASFNNSLEYWNKGCIVSYTIFCAEPGNVTYGWEIANIVTQKEVCLLSYLQPHLDTEEQIQQTLKEVKGLI